MRRHVGDEGAGLAVLDLEELVREGAFRVQPRDAEPEPLGGDARTPGLRSVVGEHRDVAAARQVSLRQDRLHPPDEVGRAP